MSLEFNADKQIIKSTTPKIVGSSELTIRSGSGSDEKEIIRAQIDSSTKLPRVGINRTGRRVEKIVMNTGFNGSGYTATPTVTLSAPQLPGGTQALASAAILAGSVVAIIVDNQGDGYTSAPTVTITGGNGSGAAATAYLDTVDYELDVNGAIRTSTSIISDTARILNLDIDNFVTADAQFRAPHLKNYANNTGTLWANSVSVTKDSYIYYSNNIYKVTVAGVTGTNPPTHIDGEQPNGTSTFRHVGFRVSSPLLKYYNQDMIYPRSITPPLGDRSENIATTEYVLNLATNDVGGRVYVSSQIGDDLNDGRSAVNPVRSIKRACQIASATVGVKETVIIAGGEYVEDNPISIPPDCSIVGDNLRLVIVRPANPRKHMFKYADKNYITGITFRDKVDSSGDPVYTWDYACVFDDKQRVYYDASAGGDFGRSFPIGHQIFGPPKIRVPFQTNTGGTSLATGEYVTGVNTGAVGVVKSVTFTAGTSNVSGSVDVQVISGSFQTGETFTYPGSGATPFTSNTAVTLNQYIYNGTNVYQVTVAGTTTTNGPTHTTGTATNGTATFLWLRSTYNFVATDVKSIRAEGEVVEHVTNKTTTVPIVRVDGSQQANPDIQGVIFYTNLLLGRNNTHNFKDGQEIEISGLPTSSPDLSMFNGKQKIKQVIYDADGRSRRFVIYKSPSAFTDVNYIPSNASVKSASNYITLSLLNSPNKFLSQPYVLRRYQDACNLIRNNIEFIKDETYLQIQDEFSPNFTISSIKATAGTGGLANSTVLQVTTSAAHGFYVNDSVSIFKNALSNNINTQYTVTTKVSNTVFEVVYPGLISTLGLTSGNTYTTSTTPALSASAYVQRSFIIPNETKCRRDIGHFVNAILRDLEFGGNYNVIEAAKTYVNGTSIGYIGYQIAETLKAFDIARKLCTLAMRRWRTGNGQITDPLYSPVYSSVARYFDSTVVQDTSSPACNDVATAIDTLSYTFAKVISNNASGRYEDASILIQRNADFIASEAVGYAYATYPALASTLTDEQKRKCKRDIRTILSYVCRDLVLGGNAGAVTAAESYFTGAQLTGIPSNELAATRYAFSKVKDLAQLAMRNWKTGSNGTGATYTPVYETIIPLFTDSSVIVDSATSKCANVFSSIDTEFTLIDNILGGTTVPGATTKTYGTLYSPTITYPDNTLYDSNNKVITPIAVWDDLPYIEASPYIQNSSIISFLGGNGCEVDGDKVAHPNCPFAGLEPNGNASFPNQGKSMVASAFTIVSFGGTGYHIVNDGYCQLVSVFVIFAADGILAESGGYASVTNSATNFGIYALRARGYRSTPYSFDIGTITNTTITPTGKAQLTVSGLGRRPLEHYVVKIAGYTNTNTAIEYFIDAVSGVTVGPPFTATLTLNDAVDFTKTSTGNPVSWSNSEFVGKTIKLHRPSIVNSSGHTWEFAGSGTTYNALPENGGTKIEAYEQVSQAYGRVYTSGTDELGDFKVGYFAKIENRTGAITFTGAVTISEVEFLKLKGGDVVVTGFDASNTLGGAFSTDSKLPTQKAVKDYITNNLGAYINKPYSTNAVPRALVELTDSGKISIDQIPALRPFNVFTVADQAARLALEGALAGDIAIQTDTTQSFILNNDLTSLYLGFNVNTALQFTVGNIFTGSGSGGQIQATEYRQGVVYKILITNPGSGYTVAPTVTISGGNPQGGAVSAAATCTIANGQVVTVTLYSYNGYIGGKGYTTAPTVTFAGPGGAGVTATGQAYIESRLYGNIVNNIKIVDTDTISSSNSTPVVVDVDRVVNTSSSLSTNWVSLSATQIAASAITSGVIATSRLASNSTEANSYTFLRGDQSYAPVLQSLKPSETRYFAILKAAVSSGSSTFTFDTNASILKGHGVTNNITGIAANTTVNAVVTAAGTTTIQLNNPVTSNIAQGTVIEFTRPSSPVILDAAYTIGSFIDSIVLVNGGSGFTNGTYYDVSISGGTGSGLKANIVVSGGAVTSVVVTNGGINYNSDFTVTSAPAGIGSGSGLVLQVKLATTSKFYANTSLDIRRVDDLTVSADLYGNAGVARFKKSQFNLGVVGNGSVELKTGADSGLDADLLDGAQGAYYLNASNLNAGTLSTDRLSGTYNIGISGQSGNTLRLITSVNNPTSSPSPNSFSEGIIADTRNNTADSLSDGGTRHLVLSLRNYGTGFDATGGGVRQLAFTDNDNMWIRGSGTGVSTFGTWAKVWTSINDGVGSGLDADYLAGNAYQFYQNAYNLNSGFISTNRISTYQTTKSFNNSVKILTTTNNVYYDVYISKQQLTASPFLAGLTVNLYDVNAQGTGTLLLTNVVNFTGSDASLNYCILTGVLQTGTFTGAQTIGTASNRVAFQDYTLNSSGTFQTASLDSDTGTARLRLGRKDGASSTPGIYFSSSSTAASNYNSAIVASGGSGTDGSGSLNIVVTDSNALTVNNNAVWNAGNLTPATNSVANSVVLRDASGNFAAGTITASLTGAASLNVLKAGDTMTGNLLVKASIGVSESGGTGNRLNISSASTGSIFVQNDTTGDLIFQTNSGTEQGRFRNTANGGGLSVTGPIIGSSWAKFGGQIYISPTNLNTLNGAYDNNSAADMWINYRGYQDGFTQFRSLNIGNGKSANIAYFDGATSTASIGNGQTVTSQYRLYVNGAFAATSKSFKIPHPTKENHDLVYGSLEGPEHGVYVRGKSSDVIELPDYWVALVDENTITVQLTPIGNHMSWVEKIEDNKILIGGGEAFYFVQAMRKDIEPLEVEVELPVEEEV